MSELTTALRDCGALQFGDFTLASGAKSEYYIDIKKASTNPKVLYMISILMAEKMQDENLRPDRIAGVVLGSVPLAAALSLATGIPYVMVPRRRRTTVPGSSSRETSTPGTRSLLSRMLSPPQDRASPPSRPSARTGPSWTPRCPSSTARAAERRTTPRSVSSSCPW